MQRRILELVAHSVKFHKKPVLYQIIIIFLLAAVITGSLLTGSSVRESLRKSSLKRLGNTGILISSGIRYFDPGLVRSICDSSGNDCSGIVEVTGFCQSLNAQKTAYNVHIFGVTEDYFRFQGQPVSVNAGEVAVNAALADHLGIKVGDEISIKFSGISDMPADAPFAVPGDAEKSVVLKIGNILEPSSGGNFSLLISQITPLNIFINIGDLEDDRINHYRLNRILLRKNNLNSAVTVTANLKRCIKPEDIGLTIRKVQKTSNSELISNRIFIDEAVISEVQRVIPEAAPIITYMANRISAGNHYVPYSFVSALPKSLYPAVPSENGITINRWTAKELSVNEGDTLTMSWYSPDSLNHLVERSRQFVIRSVVDFAGIWADSLLMPDFPGISGKQSCTDWDAGVPVNMHEIRRVDEDYWNRYRGTPKAFLRYKNGLELWGNNFGPATALRFPAEMDVQMIKGKLRGSIDPLKVGFTVVDLSEESLNAANESVDFGTLFLSLGFFLILASLVLLSFATKSYFDSGRRNIHTLYALGFRNKLILRILFLETGLIASAGCFIGAFGGYFADVVITKALNTVWYGAVQTDTLTPDFSAMPLITGFLITFLTTMLLNLLVIRSFLKKMHKKEKTIYLFPSSGKNISALLVAFLMSVTFFILSFFYSENQLVFSFSAGVLLLFALVLLWRQLFIDLLSKPAANLIDARQLSYRYYRLNLTNAVLPVLFIAAGIFTVFITGVNRMDFNKNQLNRSGGTGRYLLWCETTVAINEDLNSDAGRRTLGLDEDQLRDIKFVPVKRSQGNDASCLNLNHITAPPLLGIDPADLIANKAFSFSKVLSARRDLKSPWQFLNIPSEKNTIYGIADQTVLEWGLKIKIGDTLIVMTENGQPLGIIMAAGLKSSVFQGNVLIGTENFTKFFPSVSRASVLLVDGNPKMTEVYSSVLSNRLENYGIDIQSTTDRLATFYEVTNTYLSVFGVFGALGMIVGIAGLGFVLLRNFILRKREYALMIASGFKINKIRRIIFSEYFLVLIAGVSTGILSAVIATLPSLQGSAAIPWFYLIVMILAIVMCGLSAIYISVRSISTGSLTEILRKDL